MKKLTNRQIKAQLEALARMPDSEIDLSEIPELTPEQMRNAKRGLFYRPMKKPVTMRLDADVLNWLKESGPGYQTKANALLRREMLRALGTKKRASRQTASKSRSRRAG